ncbi:MAG: L,D-transpeptidase family protein [Alphaproteobacteria bacterium]|nr:L,D-transpeptidase family protein [Alphaproteobacteria bacterium]
MRGPLFDEPCALGKHGVVAEADGREGDGKTPAGTYPFRKVFYRPDREEAPMTALPLEPLSPELGWCDDVESEHYNKLVRLPFGPSHEKMWREDALYDLVVILGHNDAPVVKGLGSAIFLHVAREGFKPTLGCIALEKAALRRFLRQVQPDDQTKILTG